MKLKFNINAAAKKQIPQSPNIQCFDNPVGYNDHVDITKNNLNVIDCNSDQKTLVKKTCGEGISLTPLDDVNSRVDSLVSQSLHISCDEREDFNVNLEMSMPLNSHFVTSHSDIKPGIEKKSISEISHLTNLDLENSGSKIIDTYLMDNNRSESISDNMGQSFIKSVIPKFKINLSKATLKRTPQIIPNEHVSLNETNYSPHNLDNESNCSKMVNAVVTQELDKEKPEVVLEKTDLSNSYNCEVDMKTTRSYSLPSPIPKFKINLIKAVTKNMLKTLTPTLSIDHQSMVPSEFVTENQNIEKENSSQEATESLVDIPRSRQGSESPGFTFTTSSVPAITKSRNNLSKAVSITAKPVLITASQESKDANGYPVPGRNVKAPTEESLDVLNVVDNESITVTIEPAMENCDDIVNTRSKPIAEFSSDSRAVSGLTKSRFNLNRAIGKQTPTYMGNTSNLENLNQTYSDHSGSKIITGGGDDLILQVDREPQLKSAVLDIETNALITEKADKIDSVIMGQVNKENSDCDVEDPETVTIDSRQLFSTTNFDAASPRMEGPMKSKINVKNAICKDQLKNHLISNSAKPSPFKTHNIHSLPIAEISNDNSACVESPIFIKERATTRKRIKSDSSDQWDRGSTKSSISINDSMTSSKYRRRNSFVLKHHKFISSEKSSICDESIRLKDLINCEAYMPPPKKRGMVKSKPSVPNELKRDSESEADQPECNGPKFRIDLDGRIVVDDRANDQDKKSFNREGMELVVEDANDLKATYKSYTKRRLSGRRWSEAETKLYYQALMMVGTNFSAMATIFSSRSREDLKKKYKVEEKRNPNIIDQILQNPRPWNVTSLKFEVPEPDSLKKKKKSRVDVVKRNWHNSPGSDEEITPRKKIRRFVPDPLKLDETVTTIPDYLKMITKLD